MRRYNRTRRVLFQPGAANTHEYQETKAYLSPDANKTEARQKQFMFILRIGTSKTSHLNILVLSMKSLGL